MATPTPEAHPAQLNAAAIILAGGQSLRMGRDKALLDWHGRPLLQHIAEQLQRIFPLVLISGDPGHHAFLGLPVIEDEQPNRGPLMGLYSCLRQSTRDWNFTVACDTPVIPDNLAQAMYHRRDEAGCVVPLVNGHREPAFAFYHRRLLPTIEQLLAGPQASLQGLLRAAQTVEVPVEPGIIASANTMEEYQALRELHRP